LAIAEYYENEKRRFLENCIQCGLCAQECPILSYTEKAEDDASNIQAGVYAFLESGNKNQEAYTKAFACMECFKCTADVCPQDLNPMLINEFIKRDYISKRLADRAYSDAAVHDSTHRVLASVLVSASEYEKITTPSEKKGARFVFFPGCNVYYQPEKILSALDIMDAIGDAYAYVPGLDNCCGDGLMFLGDINEGGRRAEDLVSTLSTYQPEAVILWCPTCHCRFDNSITKALDVPFKVLSFPQYLAKNMHKLKLSDAAAGTVTLHEPCKSAYTGVDLNGARDMLRQLPGVTLREMSHHGKDTHCCGSGAICWYPQSAHQVRDERLKEAAQTCADRLVAVCHYCNQTFAAEEQRYNFQVTNYVSLVAEALNIKRDDKFKKYSSWKDLERIMSDAAENISGSHFEMEQIIEVLTNVFID